MNISCEFCSHGSCRADNKCGNRNKKGLLKQDFGAGNKQVQHTATIETTTSVEQKDSKNAGKKTNKCKKAKFNKKQLEQDLKELKNENLELNEKIVKLEKSVNILTEELGQEKKRNDKLTEDFNTALLDNEDYQCCICREVFIKPSLLNCSHMFCEWCIDKWLEKYNHCPICRIIVVHYHHCLNMNNFVQRRMQLMPAKVRFAYKKREEVRAKEKEMSIVNRAERLRYEQITRTLNQNRSNRSNI